MPKLVAILFAIILSFSFAYAQSNPAEKKLAKVQALLEKNKIDKAETQLVKLLGEYSTFGQGWDLLSKIRLYQYNQSKSQPNLLGNLTITTTDKDGNKVASKDDSLGNSLMNLLKSINPSKSAYNKYIFTLRKATLSSNTAFMSSINLRNEFRVPEVDTLVSTKALKFYNKAEEEFAVKNYAKAAVQYKRALEEQPDFYKAQLYLADTYYYTGHYIDAIRNFKICAERYPTLLEPRKYLVDAYREEGLYEDALAASIETILVYPDPTMFIAYEVLLYGMDKRVSVEWQPRPIFPNAIEKDSTGDDYNQYSESNSTEPSEPWNYYVDALPKIEQYCDEKGLISDLNSLTAVKYLEVYSWHEMLRNNDSDELRQAREMQEKGYLDCFVLITCFHDGLFDQYLHFVTNNKEKVRKYFNEIIVSSQP